MRPRHIILMSTLFVQFAVTFFAGAFCYVIGQKRRIKMHVDAGGSLAFRRDGEIVFRPAPTAATPPVPQRNPS